MSHVFIKISILIFINSILSPYLSNSNIPDKTDKVVTCIALVCMGYNSSLTGVRWGTHCRSNIMLCIEAVIEVTCDANLINTRRLLETRLQDDGLKFSLAA